MKEKLIKFLRWSEKYTKTDMVYLAKGGFWIMFAKGTLVAASFVAMLAFANWLPANVFSAYTYVFSVACIVGIITLPGMDGALVRSVAKGKHGTFIYSTKTRLQWGFFGSLILLGFAAWYFVNADTQLASAFLIFALLLPFIETLNTQVFSYWQGRKKFDIRAKYTLIYQSVITASLLAALYYSDNLLLIIAAYFIAQAVMGLVIAQSTKRRLVNDEVDPECDSLGKHLTVFQGLVTVTNNIDKIIIWHLVGPGAVAIYTFAKQPIAKFNKLAPIQALAAPKLSTKIFDHQTKQSLLSKFYKMFLLFVPLTLLIYWLAPFLYEMFLPKYPESMPYFRALLLLLALSPFQLLAASFAAGFYKKELYITRFISPLLKLLLLVTLAPLFGLWGMIYAILFIDTANALATYVLFRKLKM